MSWLILPGFGGGYDEREVAASSGSTNGWFVILTHVIPSVANPVFQTVQW